MSYMPYNHTPKTTTSPKDAPFTADSHPNLCRWGGVVQGWGPFLGAQSPPPPQVREGSTHLGDVLPETEHPWRTGSVGSVRAVPVPA